MKVFRNQQGQVAVEFLASFCVSVALFVGLTGICAHYFLKIRCTELGFRKGRERLLSLAFSKNKTPNNHHFIHTERCRLGPLSTQVSIPFKRLEFLDNRGQMTLILSCMLILFSLASFGLFKLTQTTRQSIETQVLLDRCVGQGALKFANKMRAMEIANAALRGTRATLKIASKTPAAPAIQSLRLLINMEYATLRTIQSMYEADRMLWLTTRCGNLLNEVSAPKFPWEDNGSDIWGYLPFRFTGKKEELYYEVKQRIPFQRTGRAEIRNTQGMSWQSDWNRSH